MLTQAQAEALIELEKAFVKSDSVVLTPGERAVHDLVSNDGREQFQLDVWRGTFRVSKVRYQTKGR